MNRTSAEGARPRVRLVTMAWGERYINELFDFALPAILAPNNLPAVVEHFSCEMIIVTEEAWFDRLSEHPIFRRIQRYCAVELRPLDEFISQPDAYGMALTYALFRGFDELGSDMLNINLIFFNADFILADGALRSVAKKILEGERLILSPSYCVVLEQVAPWLTGRRDSSTGVLAVPPREMASIAIQHRHNTIRGKTVNQNLFSQEWIDQFYWLVDQQTLLGHQLPIAVVCMRPERVLTEMRTYWDYGIISEACPKTMPCVLGDSDDFLMIELRRADTAGEQIALGWPTPKQIAEKLQTFMTKDPLSLAHHTLILHSGDLPPSIEAAKDKLEAFVNSVLQELPKERPDHVNHPIWAYHYPKFQAARRDYLVRRGLAEKAAELDEKPSPPINLPNLSEIAVAAPTQPPRSMSARTFVHRLARRFYGTVLGFAPAFQLSHPRWGDVQPILRGLEGCGNAPVLVISSASLAERLFRRLPGTHTFSHQIMGVPRLQPGDVNGTAEPIPRHADSVRVATASQSSPPMSTTRMVQIEGGAGLSAALRTDDTLGPKTVQLKSLKLEFILDELPSAPLEPQPVRDIELPSSSTDFARPEILLPCKAFGFCVCELDSKDLLQLRRIIALIRPAIRQGGKIFVFHINQSMGPLANAQDLIKNNSLALDLPCRIIFAGSELSAKAARCFGDGIGELRTREPRRAIRGALLLMRSLFLAHRVNRSSSCNSNRASGVRTSVTIEIDIAPDMSASCHAPTSSANPQVMK